MTPKLKQKREQWEYAITRGFNGIVYTAELDARGSQGFELVCVTLKGSFATAYFKRPRKK